MLGVTYLHKDSQSVSVALLHGTYRQPKISLSKMFRVPTVDYYNFSDFKYNRPGIGQKRE
jgi:hypothetical protein